MPDEMNDFAALATRYRQLGAADQRAVLARFSASERQSFERRLTAEAEARRRKLAEERRADRQFACYSPTLAAKVERAVRGDFDDNGEMTRACAVAVARAHGATGDTVERTGLAHIIQKLGLRALFAADGERT